ncbi:hypothetical protein SDC9_11550 [bioreactor metagenome]|jgi:wyosine [tRNA(Phe)-imidazoG37] synthetase (radical SAM superfamily)|uniref:Radical SAM domain protein n=2 Tax=root TaxID=1 RepID=A0A652ZXI0_9SPIR|nr:hypothetical protein [Spirochaetales bacterium]VBB40518.1 hypothetical protein TRIP_E300045 [uncultured Spirochaetota bacterium]
MPMFSEEVVSHKRGENGASLVYPVFSRRSEGLSLGVNLFPDRKRCNFDCPYCEVSHETTRTVFDIGNLNLAIKDFFERRYLRHWAGLPIKDICISGNGEPSLSPHLEAALELCAEYRRRFSSIAGASELVIITNSTGFLDPGVSELLARYVEREGLKIWAKLDSGSQDGFQALSRSAYRLDDIVDGIGRFARSWPVILQTMVCALNGEAPGTGEALAYAALLDRLLSLGAKIEAIQLYTIARTTADPSAQALSDGEMLAYAAMLGSHLGKKPSLRIFGRDGAIRAARE